MDVPRTIGAAPRVAGTGLAAIAALSVLAGCGGGVGKGSGGNHLGAQLATTTAPYQIIDLANGTVSAASAVPDLATNAAYTSSLMVFRLVPAGSATLGQAAGSFAAQADEIPGSVTVPRFYLGVFEVTQAQWLAMTGTTPTVQVQAVVGGSAVPVAPAIQGNLPVFGVSFDQANAGLAQYHAAHAPRLDLPSEAYWEYACRAGGNGLYSWGNARGSSVAGDFALVWETSPAATGPEAVGIRQPNAFGLYDMHGNVWELTKEHTIRGGSWHDPVSLARSANRGSIETDTAHALVGMRLVYLPQ